MVGEPLEKRAHRFGRDLGQHEGEAVTCGRTHRGVEVGPIKAAIAEPMRPLAAKPPAIPGAALLPNATAAMHYSL